MSFVPMLREHFFALPILAVFDQYPKEKKKDYYRNERHAFSKTEVFINGAHKGPQCISLITRALV